GMNGDYEINGDPNALLPRYTKEGNAEYNMYFVQTSTTQGRWAIATAFHSTVYRARSNIVTHESNQINPSGTSWEYGEDSREVTQTNSKWVCLDASSATGVGKPQQIAIGAALVVAIFMLTC
ncbi:unnamed protein product, partial [Owenia fusiformis]